jgi:hypothetical protein
VCGPFSLHTKQRGCYREPKDELKKLLEDLSDDSAASGIAFVILVDAYISPLDANCSDIAGHINLPRAQHRTNIDSQLRALHAQYKTSELRVALFERVCAAARKQVRDLQAADGRRTFRASSALPGQLAAERRRQKIHREMIVCVSPDPDDTVRLLDYSV